MPLADREFSFDMVAITVGGINIFNVFESVEIEISHEYMRAEAGADASDAHAIWDFPRVKSNDFSFEARAVVDDTISETLVDELINNGIGPASDVVSFLLEFPPISVGGAHPRIFGNLTLESADLAFPGEAATQSIRGMANGPISFSSVV